MRFGTQNEQDITDLTVHARKLGISYGQLVQRTTKEERDRILREERKERRTNAG